MAYYIIAHASKFVPPVPFVLAVILSGNLYNVAFKTPGGKKVLIVENDGQEANFNIRFNGQWATTFSGRSSGYLRLEIIF